MKGAPLTVTEARVILRADEAFDLTYDTRLAAGTTFSDEEREAWTALVESANNRLATWSAKVPEKAPGYTAKHLINEDLAEIAELLRVLLDDNLDDTLLRAWHPRLREIREKMILRLGDVVEQRSTP